MRPAAEKAGLAVPVGLSEVLVSRTAFVASYNRVAAQLARNYSRVLENPSPKQVHDARTATRRAEAHLALLPRSLRHKRRWTELEESYRKVMEKTAAVRDMDVVMAKLGADREGGPLLETAQTARRRAVSGARAAVAYARQLEPPSIAAEDVRRTRLQRRFEKVAGRLSREVEELLPLVLRDPSDVKDLHRLRIDLKKLRYLLEAVSAGQPLRESWLEVMQDTLGSIHDWDLSIAFVRRRSPGSELPAAWAAQRDREFGELALSLRGRGA